MWDRFRERFAFRPHVERFPGITEPPGSATRRLSGQPPWPGSVWPDGDYYVHLTPDLRMGTFGHPRERTLCVFGEPLVAQLEQPLTALPGPPVRRS